MGQYHRGEVVLEIAGRWALRHLPPAFERLAVAEMAERVGEHSELLGAVADEVRDMAARKDTNPVDLAWLRGFRDTLAVLAWADGAEALDLADLLGSASCMYRELARHGIKRGGERLLPEAYLEAMDIERIEDGPLFMALDGARSLAVAPCPPAEAVRP